MLNGLYGWLGPLFLHIPPVSLRDVYAVELVSFQDGGKLFFRSGYTSRKHENEK